MANYISLSDHLRSSGQGVSGGIDWRGTGKAAAGAAAQGGTKKKIQHAAVPMMPLSEFLGPGLLPGAPPMPGPDLQPGQYSWRRRYAPEIMAPPPTPTPTPAPIRGTPSRQFSPNERGPSWAPMPGRDWMELLLALSGGVR